MASVDKFTHGAVANQLRHCKRQIKKDNNKDIDSNRTHLNFCLTPQRNMSEFDYYKKRKEELYCYGRADVKTMAGWIVTAPQELTTRDEEILFFKRVYHFLENRYGKENVISATVHYDEGKMEKCKDRWGEYIKDEKGEIKRKLAMGRPHLHFNFIPVVEDKNPKHIQSEKICANERLNRVELRKFHKDLQQYLKDNGMEVKVITGKTKVQGRNYTVEELKEKYETQKEIERLREIERKYNREHQRTYERGRW